ncbi:MAG: hypothetical protein K6F33_09650 [Bacteroidales bacterium]|nr:hypothetical protein [Bacteroidales bacterium]
MKVLLTAMAAMAETGGPSSRCRTLATAFKDAGMEVATCLAEDVNYKKINGIKNYFLEVPMPLGLPKVIAKRMFPIVQKLGISARKEVKSFDQVLYFTGNLDYKYLKISVENIRKAIKDFNPDVVYSEFNVSALIAAKIEGKKLLATTSYPTQYNYANNPKLSHGLNKMLQEYSLPQVKSALQLIDFADQLICPSIPELEPIKRDNVTYCGTFKRIENTEKQRDKILVYMGNGTISPKKMLHSLVKNFNSGDYEVFMASKSLEKSDIGNIHIAKFWNFDNLLNEAVLFINHGGQNSVADGLIHGVPQLILPGKVFERKYNAQSIVDNNAGATLSLSDLATDRFLNVCTHLINSIEIRHNAASLGDKLLAAGGTDAVVRNLMV